MACPWAGTGWIWMSWASLLTNSSQHEGAASRQPLQDSNRRPCSGMDCACCQLWVMGNVQRCRHFLISTCITEICSRRHAHQGQPQKSVAELMLGLWGMTGTKGGTICIKDAPGGMSWHTMSTAKYLGCGECK